MPIITVLFEKQSYHFHSFQLQHPLQTLTNFCLPLHISFMLIFFFVKGCGIAFGVYFL